VRLIARDHLADSQRAEGGGQVGLGCVLVTQSAQEAGADPVLVTSWINETQAKRAAAQARLRKPAAGLGGAPAGLEEHPGHGRQMKARPSARTLGALSAPRVFIQAAWGPAVPAILVCAGSPDRVVQEAGG
jgi:hypothetical protein